MKNANIFIWIGVLLLAGGAGFLLIDGWVQDAHAQSVRALVEKHATAWETGDDSLLFEVLHEDAVFAYPGRRLNKQQTLDDIRYFQEMFEDTKVYVNTVIVEGDDVAVEWQFATTNKETGKREVVSDAIIAKVKDGQFIVWKEYLDGRVKGLQAEGKLEFEEGKEPFPWPAKTSSY